MTTRYFRVQDGALDITELLDPERVSSAWHRTDRDRPGVSVCESREELARYLATAGSGIPYGSGGWVIVELEGEVIPGADPLDAEWGEVLIRPTRVVDVAEIDDEFFEMVGHFYETEGIF